MSNASLWPVIIYIGIHGDVLTFVQVDGTKGAVDLNQVDWRNTIEMTSQLRAKGVPEISARVN